MSNSYLLDTVAAIALLNGKREIADIVQGAAAIYLSVITLGELYFGAENSQRKTANIQKVDTLAQHYPMLECDHETSRTYGRIFASLRAKGRPIQTNDVWIAAITIQNNLVLLTRDTDFNNIDTLQTKSW